MDTVDALIIAAVSEEYTAAREAGERLGGTQWVKLNEGSAESFLLGRFGSLTVALARAPGMGSREGGQFIATLIDRVRPASLAMCGVCAGHPDETVLGDVIVAELAYQYDEGKQTATMFHGDHHQYPLAAAWKRTAEEFDPAGLPSHRTSTEADADEWYLNQVRLGRNPLDHPANVRFSGVPADRLARLNDAGLLASQHSSMALTAAGEAELKRLRAVAARPAQLPYAVRTGPMASVNQVRKDPDLWSAIEARGMRKIFAVEMEAATIATAAHQRDLRWLVVKGVMDHSNSEKNDNVKEFAARASAEVMFTLLTKFESAAATSRDPIAFGGVPGNIKLAFFRSLLSDWIDLAVRLDVPRHATYRFAAGEEPRQLWEWLEARGRLRELPEALDGIGRTELADLLRRYL